MVFPLPLRAPLEVGHLVVHGGDDGSVAREKLLYLLQIALANPGLLQQD